MKDRWKKDYAFTTLNCHTEDPKDLNDGSHRTDKRDCFLPHKLREAVYRLNDVPESAVDDAIAQLTARRANMSMVISLDKFTAVTTADFLSVIPDEVIECDYGCGDPTPYVKLGETILDLGSGGGKLCFIAAQAVGAAGRMIGVDCNREMLALAKKHAPTVAVMRMSSSVTGQDVSVVD